MKRKWIAAIMVVSMLAGMCGCAGAGPEAPEGGDSEDSQTGSLADSQPSADDRSFGDSQPSVDGQPSGASQPAQDSGTVTGTEPDDLPEVYVPALYVSEEGILQIDDTAVVDGISYHVERVEYTEKFGDRDLTHLNDGLKPVDDQGSFVDGTRYLFLTITFTNTTDETREIWRNQGGIYTISSQMETIHVSGEAVYYDVYWEGGTGADCHHWVLEPGESVTSEVGWYVDIAAQKAEYSSWEECFGSDGSIPLYYMVKLYDGDNEGSYFIDLGVQAE